MHCFSVKKSTEPELVYIGDNHVCFIDYLRILACVFVVMIHTAAYNADLFESLPFSDYVNFLIRVAVPLFFFVSGYVMMKNYSHKDIELVDFVKKRTKRLLVPYFSFTITMIILRVVVEVTHIIPVKEIVYFPFRISIFFNHLFFAGVAQHLYFLPSMLIINMIFPLFYRLIRNKKKNIYFALLYFISSGFVLANFDKLGFSLPEPNIIFHAIRGLNFFLVGTLFFNYEQYCHILLKNYGIYLFSILFVSSLVFFKIYYDIYKIGSSMLGISYISLAYYLGQFKSVSLTSFSQKTLGIYLYHPYFVKIFTLLGIYLSFNSWFTMNIVVILAFICSALLVGQMKKNKYIRVLFLGEKS